MARIHRADIRRRDKERRRKGPCCYFGSGQRFHARWNETGYLYTPDEEHNLLPEVKEIYWKRYKMGFGGRGCGLDTEVLLKEATSEDCKVYEKILTPTVIETGRWEPYPDYSYVPMLTTAFNIRYAYQMREEMAKKVKMADQNLADALALREATHKYLGRE